MLLFSQRTCSEKTTAKSSKSLEPGTATSQIGFKIFHIVAACTCARVRNVKSPNDNVRGGGKRYNP